MARPSSAYFGSDMPGKPPRRPGVMGPAQDVPIGADGPMAGLTGLEEPPSSVLGSGGGADPRLGVEGEPPPYEPNGEPLYEDEEVGAHDTVSSWLERTFGISPEEAGGMTLDTIMGLAQEAAPTDQGLMNALGVLNTGNANVPVEDPSAGPGSMPRYVPDR